MEKVLIVDPDRCTRCRICELVCSFAKYGEFNPKRSLIKVLSNEEMNMNIPVLLPACDLCDGEEKCVHFCPNNVLQFVQPKDAALLRRKVKLTKFPAPIISGLK